MREKQEVRVKREVVPEEWREGEARQVRDKQEVRGRKEVTLEERRREGDDAGGKEERRRRRKRVRRGMLRSPHLHDIKEAGVQVKRNKRKMNKGQEDNATILY